MYAPVSNTHNYSLVVLNTMVCFVAYNDDTNGRKA